MTTEFRAAPQQLTVGGDLTVHRIGYGAMHLTGPGVWGPPADPDRAVKLLRRAVELGVDFIDTADSYGPGHNERVIRAALHPYPDGLAISTKGGLLRTGPTDWDHKGEPYITPLGRPEYLRQQVELSLHNLGVERIDLYQLHRIDPAVPLADQLGELVRLQQQGKIRHIGLSGQPGVTLDELARAGRHADIVAVENLYNLADRTDEPVLRHAEEQGLAHIPWFPLGHGGLVDPGGPLARIAPQFGAEPAQLALAWLLHHSPATLLIPGTTRIDHLESNMCARRLRLSAGDLRAIADAVDAARLPLLRPCPVPPPNS
ncbi:aldo/keto reductase [Streptomyces monticola]|uniref:Aldo/keto reductase n=1 Tax=Streptomyces monticola TaxID=2666263 RepID=A0ABW2JS62_9ACTN